MKRFFSQIVFLVVAVALPSTGLAANLVQNGGFDEPGAVTAPRPAITRPDNRIPLWTMEAEWHVDEAMESPVKGAQVIRAGGKLGGGQLLQYVYLEPGKEYTLSAWVRAEGLQKVGKERGDSQSCLVVTNWRWTASFAMQPDISMGGGAWKRQHITFKAPDAQYVAGVEQPCMIRVFLPKTEQGTLWVTGIQIEEGKKARDFQFVSRPQLLAAQKEAAELVVSLDHATEQLAQFSGGAQSAILKEVQGLRERVEGFQKRLVKIDVSQSAVWRQLTGELQAISVQANRYGQPFGWWANAWADLPLRALPGKSEEMKKPEVRITLGINDYGAVLLPFANLSSESVPVEVRVGEEHAPLSVLSSYRGPIQVSTAYWVSHEGYVSKLSPAKSHRKYPYFLQPLGAGNTTLLSPSETTQLWFDIDTKGLPAGEHRYPVKLLGLNGRFAWEGSIIVDVQPVELPEKVPTNVMAYAAMPLYMEPLNPSGSPQNILSLSHEERVAVAKPWLRAWKEMGFNRFMLTNQFCKPEFNADGTLAQPIDYALSDAYRELWREIGDQFWAGYHLAAYHIYPSTGNFAKATFNEASKQKTHSVLESFMEHCKVAGIAPGDLPVCLTDEPHGKGIEVTRLGVEALRKIAPDAKVMAGVAATTRAQIEPLLPLLDLFIVRQRMGDMDMKPETIRYLKSKGKEVWGYSCSGSFEYLHPYRYYRLLPWQAWSNELTGYALYMTITPESYMELGARSAYFSPLFLGRGEPVIGKGARGFQLGGRDWALLTMARDAVAAGQNNGTDVKTLQSLLNKAAAKVLANENESETADSVREELLRELAKVKRPL